MSKKEKEQDEKGLKDYGIIYVSGAINDGTSESVCKEIIEFNITGEVDHIQMIINSSGGSCPAAFAIIDIMEWSRLPIYTTGLGMIASMGLLMFMTGMKGRRVITARTSILSDFPGSRQETTASFWQAGRKRTSSTDGLLIII